MSSSFLKLPSGRYVNMALVAYVSYATDRNTMQRFLNLFPAGTNETPAPIVTLEADSPDAVAVLAWLNDHSGVAGVK